MAHSKSAKKRIRQNERRRLRNKSQVTALRTQIKKMRQALEARDVQRAQAEYKLTVSALDKAVTKGVIHRNNANRHKARLARQLAGIAESSQVTA